MAGLKLRPPWSPTISRSAILSAMRKTRLEAFSDGVIAIIITIMVLELRPPHEGTDLAALRPILPSFLSYVLSFVFVGIYWNNHHHLLQSVHKVNGRILWANLHLLFWLTLIPFTTNWMGENHRAPWPVAAYGIVLLCCGGAYFVLTRALIAHHGADSMLATAVGRDTKGPALVIYAAAIVRLPEHHTLVPSLRRRRGPLARPGPAHRASTVGAGVGSPQLASLPGARKRVRMHPDGHVFRISRRLERAGGEGR